LRLNLYEVTVPWGKVKVKMYEMTWKRLLLKNAGDSKLDKARG
jgi:hypothetical protein